MLFLLECFYKVFHDPAGINSIEEIDWQSGDFHDTLLNFKLFTTIIPQDDDEITMKFISLSPVSMSMLQGLILQFSGAKLFPVFHYEKQRHAVTVDHLNLMGHGYGALMEWGGEDKTRCRYISSDILTFLKDHQAKLENRYYFTGRNQIESFPRNPTDDGVQGSITIQDGIRLESVA